MKSTGCSGGNEGGTSWMPFIEMFAALLAGALFGLIVVGLFRIF